MISKSYFDLRKQHRGQVHEQYRSDMLILCDKVSDIIEGFRNGLVTDEEMFEELFKLSSSAKELMDFVSKECSDE